LGFRESSPPSASVDFIELQASVACRGYSGKTAFTLARRDLNVYLEDLAAVHEARAIAAQLIGGWEAAEERLRLRITPAGRSGQFHARITMATTGTRTDSWQRVETDFICSPAEISVFLKALVSLSRG